MKNCIFAGSICTMNFARFFQDLKLTDRMSRTEILLLSLVILFSLLYILTIFTRIPNGDEGLQAEHVYFLHELGYVKSDIWAGYGFDWEVRQFHYHKGLILLGWLSMQLFGFSLAAFRVIAVVFYLLMIRFMYLFFKELPVKNRISFFLLTVLVLLVSNVFAEFGFIFRPEIVIMSLGMGSFYYLHKGLTHNKLKYFIWSGLLVGLAAFTHLIGIVLIVAGGLTLLWFRRIKAAFVFSLFTLLALGLYGWDLLSSEAFSGFWYQFTNEASIADKQQNPLGRILSEHMRFFSSEREAVFSILFFLSLGLNFRYMYRKYRTFLIYGIASILSLMIISHTFTPKYSLLYFTFMSFTIALGLLRLKDYRRGWRIAMIVIAVIFFGYHTYRDIRYSTRFMNIAERNREMARLMPGENPNITAFSTFVFNEIENYTIHGFLAFWRYYTKNYPEYQRTPDDFFAFCDEMNDRYILIDRLLLTDKFYNFLEDKDLQPGNTWGNYGLLYRQDGYFIFENIRMREAENFAGEPDQELDFPGILGALACKNTSSVSQQCAGE